MSFEPAGFFLLLIISFGPIFPMADENLQELQTLNLPHSQSQAIRWPN